MHSFSQEEMNARMPRRDVGHLEHAEPAAAECDRAWCLLASWISYASHDMDFVFNDNNIVATEVTTIAELTESASEEATVDSASDTN